MNIAADSSYTVGDNDGERWLYIGIKVGRWMSEAFLVFACNGSPARIPGNGGSASADWLGV